MPKNNGVFRNSTLAGAVRKTIVTIFVFLWKYKLVIIRIVFTIARIFGDRKDS